MTRNGRIPHVSPSLFDFIPYDSAAAWRRRPIRGRDLLSPAVRAAELEAESRHWIGCAHTFLRIRLGRLPREEWWAGWTAGKRGSLVFSLPLRGWDPDLGMLSDFPVDLPQEDLVFREGTPALMYQRSDAIGQNMLLSLDFRATSSDGRVWTARVWGPRNPAWR